MALDNDKNRRDGNQGVDTPDWANGLRQFYDAVVDEPLPDSFKDLLEKLDEGGGSGSDKGHSN
ncbi:NepR family anti-sigma factor [Erythrobacter sp. F6033]|uniref:NepR family anti-sigma factor n=1 Tax=Erythrobacter sp. F6033 TaxID=2926401 RepID=UPI001FF522E0|nr:NepR family anti-sigma factor [Erythrobacter sp. F6033]MCK0127330.1 hypothetical protein [Erythrobacter sp. F6033]